MKHLLISLLFLCSQVLNAQEKIPFSEKAFQVHNKLVHEHVFGPINPDSIGVRFTKILLHFIDQNKLVFTKGDVEKLGDLGKNIVSDFSEKKVRYYAEVSSLFQKRLQELESEQKKLKEIPLQLSWNAQLATNEIKSYQDEVGRLVKQKKLFYLSCYDDLVEKKRNPFKLSKDSLAYYEQETRKRISTSKMEYYYLLRTDNTFLDEYFLMAYTMAHDPHSIYMSPTTKANFLAPLEAEKERFGFSYGLNDDNEVIITDILPGSPAWLNGEIQAQDILIAVGVYANKQVKMLEVGPGLIGYREVSVVLNEYDGKQIILVVRDKKNKQEKQIELTKALVYNDDEIVKNALYSGDSKIGYIYLPDFYTGNAMDGTERGCASDIAKCILKLKKDNIQGLILDLRGNGGGNLYEAISLTGIFIDYGPVAAELIKGGEVHVFKDVNRGMIYDGPLMILVDESSASASELVAGALQDYNKALVVGSQSYGKATSQQVIPIDPLASIFGSMESVNPEFGFSTITKSVLYRISGESNQNRGVIPDIIIGANRDRSVLRVESNEIGAIVAPPITKKMVYTKSSIPIPVTDLLAHDRLLRLDPHLSMAYNYLDSLLKFDFSNESMDYKTYYTQEEKYSTLYNGFDSETKALNWSGVLSSNSFDMDLYSKNPVLAGFYKEFIQQIQADFELQEALGIMEKWLSLKNK